MLEEIFQELNSAHFQAELPVPKLSWNSRLSSSAGRFCPGPRRLFGSSPAEIEVATYLRDLPDGPMHVRDTVLHEMIHYYLWHRKRPYGHNSEFHRILKQVGAKRYNTVPKERPIKHWYECPACRKRIPARRRMGTSACAPCCEKFNRGRYDERFRLFRVEAGAPDRPASSLAAPRPAEVARLPVFEIIRRLEELKERIKNKTS